MLDDVGHVLQDLGRYAGVFRRKAALRRPGRGTDFTSDRYRRLVRETVERLHPARMELRVVEVVEETPTARTLRFERVDGPLPPFRAGQYVNLHVEIEGIRTSRPYSMSSPPGAPLLDLTVREKPGGFVSPYLIHGVRPGDRLFSSGPAGSFYHEPLIDGTELGFLAGGSGVTPFMSILRQCAARGFPLRVNLFHGCRRPDDVIFGKELRALGRQHEPLAYREVISEPPEGFRGLSGFLDARRIRKHVGNVEGKTFYLCGPNAMYDFCLPELERLGVPRHKIRRELYGPPEDITREPGWPETLDPATAFEVEVLGRGRIRARAGEPLLNALERQGLVVPALCRSGECSACRIRVEAGRVFMPASAGLRESDRWNGYVHACVSYPLEDLKIRIWPAGR